MTARRRLGRPRVVVVGDALLDRDLSGTADRLCPDAPVPVIDRPRAVARPGGAGLAAALAAGDGVDVTLVAPVADDRGGGELVTLLEAAGVRVEALSLQGTTAEKVRVRAGQQSLVRLDYGEPGRVGSLTGPAATAIDRADAVLVSDYGRGVTAEPTVRHALAARLASAPVIWDPHPRGSVPVPGVKLATPNMGEASALSGMPVGTVQGVTAAATTLLERWRAGGVVITRGAQGALLVSGDGTPLAVPAPSISGDPCGAGDRFASAAAVALARGALLSEAVVVAVASASAFVAAGGAAALGSLSGERPHRGTGDADELIARVRARGGTVVATGGCFDLLHAGHVRMLESARGLGDCLVVCLNSDASVRRLKGPDRPLVPEEDRRHVLAGLSCVDAIVTFEEDTPEAVLARLRPDIWAKGADYAVADLPEAALVSSWGGQAVVLPYLDGRSTTRLIQEVARRGRS